MILESLAAAPTTTEPFEMGWYDTILYPFMWLMGWVLKLSHDLLTVLGMESGAGIGWVMAIILMTLIVRLVMIPLFVKQIKGGRAMQMAQPELTKVREKYKGKRDQQSQMMMMEETRAIQRKYGASASASCLPMLVQMPVFLALYRLLYNLEYVAAGTLVSHDSIGGMGQDSAKALWDSTLFGQSLGLTMFGTGSTGSTKALVVAMVAYLVVVMFLQTKYLTIKNMSDEQLNSDNPMMRSTRMMFYFMPLMYIFIGPVAQIGLLLYWVVGNTFQFIQQALLVRAYPVRGSAAARWRKDAHEAKFEKFRESETGKLEAKIADIEKNEAGLNAKGVEAAIRDERKAFLRALEKRRMELGLDEINLGKVDGVAAGQRMQPGRKGWDQYITALEEDEADQAAEAAAAEKSQRPVVGKDGLTDSQRAQKQAARRAAERKAAAAKRKKKGKN